MFLKQLSHLAIHQLLGDRAESVMNFFSDRYTDCSQRIPRALRTANERAWKTLEISLAGSTFWERFKMKFVAAEQLALSKQIKAFLDAVPLPEPQGGEPFKRICLGEMRIAYKSHHLPGAEVAFVEVQDYVKQFSHLSDPKALLRSELDHLAGLVGELKRLGYTHLADFVALRPDQAQPLLVMSVRYFFRREVESDPKLAAGLTFQQLEGLTATTEAGFQCLQQALHQNFGHINDALLDIHQTLEEVRDEVVSTGQNVREMKDDVTAMREELQLLRSLLQQKEQQAAPVAATSAPSGELQEMRQQLQQMQELYEAVFKVVQPPPASAPAALAPAAPAPAAPAPVVASSAPPTQPVESSPPPPSVQNDWQQVRALLRKCEGMSREQKQQMPALVRVVTKLQLGEPTARQPSKPSRDLVEDSSAPQQPLFGFARRQGPAPPAPATNPEPQLISSIFLQGTRQPENTEQVTGNVPTAAPSPPGTATNEPNSPAENSKKPRLLSPLFQKKPASDSDK